MSAPSEQTTQAMLRNLLLGAWAAEKLGLAGAEAEAYATALAGVAASPAGDDVFGRLRSDFDAAGVALSDDAILAKITETTLRAGDRLRSPQANAVDGAAVALARTLGAR